MKIDLKKKILISLVCTEIIFGSISINKYYRFQTDQKKIKGVQHVAFIDQKNTISSSSAELQYYWQFSPNSSYSDQPDWLEEIAEYHINTDGLNDRFDYSIEKPSDTFRIITLGDSFTFGQGISTSNNWTELLEDNLNQINNNCGFEKFEVINLGMPGYDIQYTVKRFIDIGKKYQPDLVIWFESSSGFSRFNELRGEFIDDCEKQYEDRDSLEELKNYYHCSNEAAEKLKKTYSPQFLNKILNESFQDFFSQANQEQVIIFYYKKMDSIKETYLTELRQKYPQALFINTVPNKKKSESLPDGHPNKIGHQTISQNIYEYIINSKLNCN